MTRAPVKSQRIKSLGHDAAAKVMEVEFKDGHVYQYPGVDTIAFTKLKTAKSIGQHFNATYGKQKGIPADPKTIAHEANRKPGKSKSKR
jgi:hypothetical protein